MNNIKETLLLDDNLEKILEHYEYENINRHRNEIRCSRGEDSNPTAIRIKLNENISANDFARNHNGDIFSLIMNNRDLEFREVIREVKSILGISQEYNKPKTKSTFASLFGKIKTNKINNDYEIEIYPEDVLNKYSSSWNERFYKDNISIQTQIKFSIGYCNTTNRITIPWRNTEGSLIGIMGRDNTDLAEGFKYLPLIPFPKSLGLYGYSENYQYLINADVIYIFESEKSVLQAHTFGEYRALATGGNSLSEYQIKQILKLNAKSVILAYDEGLDTYITLTNIRHIKEHLVLRETKIGIIYDKENKYMKKDSKCSPTDNGKDIFDKLVKECIRYSS